MVSVNLATQKSSFSLIFSLCVCVFVCAVFLFCIFFLNFVVLSKYSVIHSFRAKKKKSCIQTTPVATENSFSVLLNLLFLVMLTLRFRASETFFKGKHIKGKGNIPVLWENKWSSKKGPSDFEKITLLSAVYLGFLLNKMRMDLMLFKTHGSSKICNSKVAQSKLDD